MLTVDDFSIFFQQVHGCPPFPWQKRLLAQVAAKGEWPDTLDLPTGSGKTAAIDIALFHLALEADRFSKRCAPVRITFVVDRRLVVDDAFERADDIANALRWSLLASDGAEALKQKLSAEARRDELARLNRVRVGGTTREVAKRLTLLSGDGAPLIARRLRGGIPRDSDWARTPSQPTVLCSTVDQIGSRLLFRGFGISDSMRPLHAGLIGSDCLILLDEAHLAEPFRQTLEWVKRYHQEQWREEKWAAPWDFALLTATPGEKQKKDNPLNNGKPFALNNEDRSCLILKKRLEASKPAFLVAPAKSKKGTESEFENDDEEEESGGTARKPARAVSIVREALKAFQHFNDAGNGALQPAIGVVVNRVGRARALFEQLRKEFPEQAEVDGARAQSPDIILMIGPARPLDRDDLADKLKPIRTRVWTEGEHRTLDRPFILVATQCIEAGVDIDLDALITEAAPLDSLRQRFGRLNRAGRAINPYAAIIASKSDVSTKADDPVYGKAIKPAWDYLREWARVSEPSPVDFGIRAMQFRMEEIPPPPSALTEKPCAPVLLPAHLDLLSQTSPIPAADPDVALYLHGPDRQPDSINVIWRADIDPTWTDRDLIRLLILIPPRSGEAIELPLWTVRRWLDGGRKWAAELADIPTREPDDNYDHDDGLGPRRIFRWKGNDERSQWINFSRLLPGDTVIVPASYGGVDVFGWNPEWTEPAQDVAHKASEPFAQKRFAVRVAPGLLEAQISNDTLAQTLASVRTENCETVRRALLELNLPVEIKNALKSLDGAKGKRGKPGITVDFELYGTNEKGEPRGVLLLAPFGIKDAESLPAGIGDEDGRPNATEDDAAGLVFDFPVALSDHVDTVVEKAKFFAKLIGLTEALCEDVTLAAELHDEGKRDLRFQAWMHFDDRLGVDPDDAKSILAKSGRWLPPVARELAGLPANWRHEALSVKLAREHARFRHAKDCYLVLWLVGSHHGYGRPFFPHRDQEEKAPVGPQSLAFDLDGLDWPSLFARLRAQYGVWELARMEAILRLADHRASEEARNRAGKEGGE